MSVDCVTVMDINFHLQSFIVLLYCVTTKMVTLRQRQFCFRCI